MKVRISNQFDKGYEFNAEEILKATTLEYREFLKEEGYVDLEKTPNLFVANNVLRFDNKVREAAKDIGLYGYNQGYVVNINHEKALRLINNLGGKVLTTKLMYGLVIPSLKDLAENRNEEALETLYEMTAIKSERLEDRVLDKSRLKIGNAERRIILPENSGRFNKADIGEYGYPTRVKDQGEFYYYRLNEDNNAAIRSRGSGLGLDLSWRPSVNNSGLGVRFAKFF